MFDKEIAATMRAVNVARVNKSTASVWSTAFQLFATFGSKKSGYHAALMACEFDDLCDEEHSFAWGAVCVAIHELRSNTGQLGQF
jgi:hypothetical protein